jgi:hypothetical protein
VLIERSLKRTMVRSSFLLAPSHIIPAFLPIYAYPYASKTTLAKERKYFNLLHSALRHYMLSMKLIDSRNVVMKLVS